MSDGSGAIQHDDQPSRDSAGLTVRLLSQGGSHAVSAFFLIAVAAMIPWVVFLGITLPRRYTARHWDLLWVGFDVALVCVLGYASWAAWFRRQVLGSTALIAGTLLLCDAWFDVVTSIGRRDQWLTLVTAVGAEIPLAIFFFWLYRQIVMATLSAVHQLTGDGQTRVRLRTERFLLVETRPEVEATEGIVADLGPRTFSTGKRKPFKEG